MISTNVVRKRTIFPGKQNTAVSFNMTAIGRHLLREFARESGLSLNDFAESLIRSRVGLPSPKLPVENLRTGPKGGAKSYFYGKNRGTLSAVLLTHIGRGFLEAQVAESGMSRGDYFEFMLRERAQCPLDMSVEKFIENEMLSNAQGCDARYDGSQSATMKLGGDACCECGNAIGACPNCKEK